VPAGGGCFAPLRYCATASLRHYVITPLRHYVITSDGTTSISKKSKPDAFSAPPAPRAHWLLAYLLADALLAVVTSMNTGSALAMAVVTLLPTTELFGPLLYAASNEATNNKAHKSCVD
jgi:hypothetical protein